MGDTRVKPTTLEEQQAEVWRSAPDDAKWIAQDANGLWWAHIWKPEQCADAFSGYTIICGHVLEGNINGWDWRDTLQSRDEWEV